MFISGHAWPIDLWIFSASVWILLGDMQLRGMPEGGEMNGQIPPLLYVENKEPAAVAFQIIIPYHWLNISTGELTGSGPG